ncbi:hypothetical protein CEXT_484341 [Caerostris extrusa]|uniref:C2H2-type domain-containing protein n=1 Tax=Caerostris extrusa TaxID=172846 RepID=A0AAV4Y6M5_CAEEX|nr:hypothetical protein CEXT_484341 [Caerostris extrusa]
MTANCAKRHQCLSCGYSTSRLADMTKHIADSVQLRLQNMASINSAISVDTPHAYAGISSLNIAKMYSGKSHQCPFCGYSTSHSANIKKHIRTHTGECPFQCTLDDMSLAEIIRYAKRHQCSYCGYSTFLSADMKKHIRIHTGERPFQCCFCMKRFNEKRPLNNHMRIHTGERPFQCPECDKTFSRKDSMKRHVTIHHPEWSSQNHMF